MRNIIIIIKKQLKDTLKNKTILIQFILFPIMTLIMEYAITLDGMPELFFTKLFSIMYIGMAPLTSVAAIISEEKEKNTLRVLMMSNVKPWQYLTGVGLYVWLICMVGAGVMATRLDLEAIAFYMCIMGIGFAISIIAGACIGIYSKNQMSATSLVIPSKKSLFINISSSNFLIISKKYLLTYIFYLRNYMCMMIVPTNCLLRTKSILQY